MVAGKKVAKKAVKEPKAASSTTGRKPGRKHPKGMSFKRYINMIVKNTHNDLRCSSVAMSILNSFMVDTFTRISLEAANLCRINKKDTLNAREIQSAVRLCLPGELSTHAAGDGARAVHKYFGDEKKTNLK